MSDENEVRCPATVHVLEQACDEELRRWQDGIRDQLIELGTPADYIDGKGCDSGDPLDFTLAEVCQGVNWHKNKLFEAEQRITTLEQAVGELVSGLRTIVESGECYCADYVAAKGPCGHCIAATLIQKHGGGL